MPESEPESIGQLYDHITWQEFQAEFDPRMPDPYSQRHVPGPPEPKDWDVPISYLHFIAYRQEYPKHPNKWLIAFELDRKPNVDPILPYDFIYHTLVPCDVPREKRNPPVPNARYVFTCPYNPDDCVQSIAVPAPPGATMAMISRFFRKLGLDFYHLPDNNENRRWLIQLTVALEATYFVPEDLDLMLTVYEALNLHWKSPAGSGSLKLFRRYQLIPENEEAHTGKQC